MGNSRGGLPVTRLAVDHPDLVTHLIISSSNTTAPDDPATDIYYYEKQEAANPPRLSPNAQKAHDIMLKLQSQCKEKYREEIERDPALCVVRSPSPWWLRDTKLETHKLIREGRLKAPTLIIWGYDDPSAPVILASRLMDMMFPVVPRGEVHIFNRAGHGPYRDHPEATVQLIVDFVKRNRAD